MSDHVNVDIHTVFVVIFPEFSQSVLSFLVHNKLRRVDSIAVRLTQTKIDLCIFHQRTRILVYVLETDWRNQQGGRKSAKFKFSFIMRQFLHRIAD